MWLLLVSRREPSLPSPGTLALLPGFLLCANTALSLTRPLGKFFIQVVSTSCLDQVLSSGDWGQSRTRHFVHLARGPSSSIGNLISLGFFQASSPHPSLSTTGGSCMQSPWSRAEECEVCTLGASPSPFPCMDFRAISPDPSQCGDPWLCLPTLVSSAHL